jgi:hypothetical protein
VSENEYLFSHTDNTIVMFLTQHEDIHWVPEESECEQCVHWFGHALLPVRES